MGPPVGFVRALPACIVTEFSLVVRHSVRERGKYEGQQEAEWAEHVDRLAVPRVLCLCGEDPTGEALPFGCCMLQTSACRLWHCILVGSIDVTRHLFVCGLISNNSRQPALPP